VPPALDGLVAVPTYRDQPATVAADLAGVDLDGRPVALPVVGTGAWTLLLFLSAACDGCRSMWHALADPVAAGLTTGERVVAVTRDPGEDDPDALRALAPAGVPVVMSSAAWRSYRVQGPPFFVLVDGNLVAGPDGPPRVATEGVAWAVDQIAEYVRHAHRRAGAGAGE
jgi:hypothetical protein